MTNTTKAGIGGAAAFLAAAAGFMLMGTDPTPVTWSCSTCPAGHATVTMRADSMYDPGKDYATTMAVDFPTPTGEVTMSFPNLPQRPYRLHADVKYSDGTVRFAEPQYLTGRGDVVTLALGESNTPTSTPSPTATATPAPTTTPTGPTTSETTNCTHVTQATDVNGSWWLSWFWLMRNGDYALPGRGAEMGAQADYLVVVGGLVIAHEPRDGQFYRWFAPNMVRTEAPNCPATPTPTATSTPTPTVTPSPTPTVTPTPTPPAPVAASVKTKTCAIDLTAPRPAAATGTSWKVQYFNGTTQLSSASTTVTRAVSLAAGLHPSLRAVWTKTGVPTITQPLQSLTCEVR